MAIVSALSARSSKRGLFRRTPLPFKLPLEPISLAARLRRTDDRAVLAFCSLVESYHKQIGKPLRMLPAEEGREIWGEDSWDWSWPKEGYETQNGTSGQDLDSLRPKNPKASLNPLQAVGIGRGLKTR